jgi:guanylate kinase
VLLVLAGPSGVGKGTIVAGLRGRVPGLWVSVSYTTRRARAGEVDGRDYRFVTRAEFEALRDAGGFVEWFEVYGDLKGTPAWFVRDALANGHDVLLEVDVQGALAIKAAVPEAVLVFVKAPSRAEQRRRLEARGTEAPDAIERRLAEADEEERTAERAFAAIVVNDDVDRAAAEIAGTLDLRRRAQGA